MKYLKGSLIFKRRISNDHIFVVDFLIQTICIAISQKFTEGKICIKSRIVIIAFIRQKNRNNHEKRSCFDIVI